MSRPEVWSDGKTVWVNAPDGMCLGRFNIRSVDVHGTTEQQAAGVHCHDCFKRTSSPVDDWKRFVNSMARVHGVEVSDRFAPTDIQPALASRQAGEALEQAYPFGYRSEDREP